MSTQSFIDPNSIPASYIPASYNNANIRTNSNQPSQNQNNGALGGFGGAAVDSIMPGVGGAINYFSGSGNTMDLIDPSGILSMLGIGGPSKPGFKPYQDANGNYVFTSPKHRNSVPMANAPGAPLHPNKTYTRMAGNTQAIQDLLPYLSNAVNNTVIPSALTNLQASQLTSPAYAELMTSLYNTYGPALNDIGNEIQKRNALAQSQTDLDVLKGPGSELVKGAYDLSQVYDKPYYDQRQSTADQLQKLFSSIDLNGNLSPTEIDAIQKGNALEGARNGTANSPSNLQSVSNAMKYGAAANARKVQQQNLLSDAISKSTAFLPTAKSGVDVFQTATGRSSQANPGNAQFTGINKPDTGGAYGLAGQMFGGANDLTGQQMNIDANKKDWLDKFNQIASGIGSLTSSAGSIAGMACWVAREVYGIDNPLWMKFRNWLFSNKSPMWFFKLYIKHGQQFAKFIRNKPFIKSLIRKWMNTKINSCSSI